MDDSHKRGSNQVIALVARQFVPSRIERQLLAQVFDLVCCESASPTCFSAKQAEEHQARAPSICDCSAEPQLARRATA